MKDKVKYTIRYNEHDKYLSAADLDKLHRAMTFCIKRIKITHGEVDPFWSDCDEAGYVLTMLDYLEDLADKVKWLAEDDYYLSTEK